MQANPHRGKLDPGKSGNLFARKPLELIKNHDRAILGIEPVQRSVHENGRLAAFELVTRGSRIGGNLLRMIGRQPLEPASYPLLAKVSPSDAIGDSIEPRRHLGVAPEVRQS